MDLPAVGVCHARAFSSSLASRHGAHFIERMLEWYVVSDRGVLFHVEDRGVVVGYCGGIRHYVPGTPGAFTSILQYSFWSFVRGYLRRPWLILHPESLAKRSGIMRNVMGRLGILPRPAAAVEQAAETFERHWGLVVIGVDPQYQGRGLGGVLIEEFERLALAEGTGLARLSVKANNHRAISRYELSGWSIASRAGEAVTMRKRLALSGEQTPKPMSDGEVPDDEEQGSSDSELA